MASTTPTVVQGLLVPDSRVSSDNIWAAQSTYTQEGGQAGRAEPQQATSMALRPTGEQTVSLDVRAKTGGSVGTASLLWRETGDTDWYGWDPPGVITSFRPVQHETGSAEAGRRHPHAVTLSDGRIVIATCDSLGGTAKVETLTRAANGTYGSSVTVHSQTASGSLEMRPTLVVLPSGRILCFYFNYASDNWTISSEYSDDAGATWTLLSDRAVVGPGATSTYVPNFIRAAHSDGQIAMLVGYVDGSNRNVRQYASIDFGSSFSSVSTLTYTIYEMLSGDIVGLPGGGFLASIWITDATNDDYWVTGTPLGSAFQPIVITSDDYIVTVTSSGTLSYGEVALSVDDRGVIYACLLAQNETSALGATGTTWASSDRGASWSEIGLTSGLAWPWWTPADDAAYPARLCAVWCRGAVFLFSNAKNRSGHVTNGNSLFEWRLGGWTTLTRPGLNSSYSPSLALWQEIAGYEKTWSSIQDPASNGFTASGSGTGALDGTEMAWRIQATSPDTKLYTTSSSPAFSDSDGWGIHAILRGDAGSSSITAGEATSDYEIRLSISVGSPTRLFFTDVSAGATLANPSVSSATWYEVIAWVQDGKASAWYRPAHGDAPWVLLADNETLSAGSVTGDYVAFGAHSGTTTDGYFRLVEYGNADLQAFQVYATGFTNPTDLRGRPTSTSAVYLGDGVSVSASGGVASAADEWLITPSYRYSIEHLHPREFPSPQSGWRSTGVTAETIAWQITAESTGGYESDLWALYLDDTNIPQLKLQYTTSTSPGWTDMGSANLYLSFAGVRSGSVVMPDPTGSAVTGRYIERDELVGGYVKVSSGDVRKIIRNDEGYLTSGSTVQKRVRIYLDETQVDATDGTSGTFELRFPRALIVFNTPFASSEGPVIGLRLVLNTATLDTPPEGYWTASKIVLGPLSVFGTKYSRTRTRTLTPNVDVIENAAGQRTSRVLGRPRQAVDVAWTEGVDQTWTSGTTQDDYVLPSSTGAPVALVHDAPKQLWGLVREIEGAHTPVVYVPAVASGSTGVTTLLTGRAGGAIYGRIVGSISAETLLGDEESDELVRCAFTLEEEL